MRGLFLFAGIGAFEKAFDNLGIDYELVGFSEIDKYAVKSYCAIHGVDEAMNLGDITKIDEKALPKDIDLVCYGFPCQDISLAGKQKGMFNEDGTQTRSGLFFDALRIIEETQPKVAIAENVKNLVGKKFKLQFEIVLKMLEAAGYNNYWKVLNAKDFGVPQNRERVFIISIRKDIDTGLFKFPEGFPLEKRLKDVLEDEVDEKYYISDSKIAKIQNSSFGQEKAMIQNGDVCSTLLARDYKDPKCVPVDSSFVNGDICKTVRASGRGSVDRHSWDMVAVEPKLMQAGNLSGGKWDKINESCRRYYDEEGLAPTIHTCQGGNTEPKVLVREATAKGYAEAEEGDYAYCIDTAHTGGIMEKYENGNLRIRKLTPKECWRLQGFDDEDFAKAEAVNSNTQLYKQAGNSIVVDVLENIFVELRNARIIGF